MKRGVKENYMTDNMIKIILRNVAVGGGTTIWANR